MTMNVMNIEDVIAARLAVRDAQNRLAYTVKHAFKPDAPVSWTKNGHIQYGTIIEVDDRGERLCVENMYTGKTYWIDLYWVVDAFETYRNAREDQRNRGPAL